MYSTAGPLTQWELIFYGTETPPHDEDTSIANNSLGQNVDTPVTSWSVAKPPDTNPDNSEEERRNGLEDDLSLIWHDTHSVSTKIYTFFVRNTGVI